MTFNLAFANTHVPVHVPPESIHTATVSETELLNFPAFKIWSQTLQRSLELQARGSHEFHGDPYALRNITVQCVDRFGGGRIGFVKLKAEISNNAGEKLPGSIFLRGGSVAMLVILQPDDVPHNSEDDKHVLLTVQPRAPAGSLTMVELPAGMIDDAGTFGGAAAKEIEEEIGLKIPKSELLDLTALALNDTDEGLQRGTYTSCGGCDEFVPIFAHQRRVKRSELNEWSGKLTGLRDHGEKITLKCVRLDALWREGGRDAKALSAWALYQGLRTAGKI
ncbi:MAG: hypothetical protein Q9162_004947 [Coniocarpon cinnabarinum]